MCVLYNKSELNKKWEWGRTGSSPQHRPADMCAKPEKEDNLVEPSALGT